MIRQAPTERTPGTAPYVLLRFNPVAFPALDGGHHALLDRIARARRERAALREDVLKALYDLAPRVADEGRLRVVLPFSRAVHNDRLPKSTPQGLEAAGADAATIAAATAWLDSLRGEHALLAELEPAVEAALAADRHRLQRILGAPDFLKAAAITSPTLASGAERYAGTAVSAHDKRNRKAEPKLARYAERAVAKTSPFSHYTVVGRGRWGRTPAGRADQGPRSVRAEPSLLFVLRLFDAALRVPEVAAGMRCRVTEAARRTGTGFEFELMRDDPAGARIYRTVRTKVAIPATRATELLVRLLAAEPAGLTVDALVRAMSEAADPPLDPEPIRVFVGKLRAAGFLVPGLVPPQQGPAPALQLADELDVLGAAPGEPVAVLADQLRALHAATAEVGTLDGARRPAALAALSRQWTEAFGHWGAPVPGGSPLFEDVAADRAVAVDRARWDGVCGDLLALLPALEPFSLDHAAAALTTLSVVDKIGVGGRLPYLEFAALLREVFTPDRISLAAILDAVGERGGAVRALLDQREEFLRPVREGSGVAEVELTEEAVARVVAATPDTLRRPVTSVSAFLQPTAQAESGTLTGAVLNSLLDGNGQFVSRFLPLWPEDDTAQVRAHLRETLPSGATELRAVQGFNANIHPRLLDREFRCDGVPADDGEEPLVDVHELDVVHDPALDRLVLEDRRGHRVHPYYLGFLVPYFLPWEQTGLYLLSQPTQFRLDAANELENRLPAEDRDRIRHYPRLRYRSLVLGRERWYVPAALFPSQQPGESLAAFLVRLDAWRGEHGIPPRVYLARIGAAEDEDAPGAAANAMGRPKPMYADLRSPLHARSLPAWLEDAATVRVEEALPDPAAPAFADPHVGDSVVEYLIEHVVEHVDERVIERVAQDREPGVQS